MTGFINPEISSICEFLVPPKKLAVVGLSPKTGRPSHHVAKAMQGFGFTVIPVRPAVSEVLGEKAYASLDEVPDPVDLAVIFRNPEFVDPIIDVCIERGIPVWMQDGVINEAAALRAQEAGLFTVMNRCVFRDYGGTCR